MLFNAMSCWATKRKKKTPEFHIKNNKIQHKHIIFFFLLINVSISTIALITNK